MIYWVKIATHQVSRRFHFTTYTLTISSDIMSTHVSFSFFCNAYEGNHCWLSWCAHKTSYCAEKKQSGIKWLVLLTRDIVTNNSYSTACHFAQYHGMFCYACNIGIKWNSNSDKPSQWYSEHHQVTTIHRRAHPVQQLRAYMHACPWW